MNNVTNNMCGSLTRKKKTIFFKKKLLLNSLPPKRLQSRLNSLQSVEPLLNLLK